MVKIKEYRVGRNFIRLGDIVKANRPKKAGCLAIVTDIEADAEGTVTAVFIRIVAKMNGDPHSERGKWRALAPDLIERVAQTGDKARRVREVVR